MSNATFIIKVQSGQKGERGLTPQLTIVDTITGAPNTNAMVSISGTGLTFTIPQGRPFIVEVEYPTVIDLENNTNSNPSPYTPTLFDLAIIVSDQGAEDPDNAKLYIFDNGPIGGWSFVSDLSGATGPRRELRWKPDNGGTTSILQWRTDDGTDWDEANERDLSLSFSFDDTELTISNIDGDIETQELGVYASFDAQDVTKVVLTNPDQTTVEQELGVYASFIGTEITLTNPDLTTVEQELALDFNWDGTTLQIKNPTEISYDPSNEQKLSPDIDFDTSNGVSISVVEPDAAQNLIKISPDIAFRNEGDGLELSIVEPAAAQSFNKISPDIDWDGTQLAIVEPGVTPASGDYVELGLISEFGAGSTTDTTLTVTNPQSGSTPIAQELGVYGEFGEGITTLTTLTLTNPDSTAVVQELGLYADFDETDVTKLIITNPDNQTVEQELGVYASFDAQDVTKVVLTNPDQTTVEQELGVYGSFDSQQSATTLVITNPDEATVEQELGVYAEWGTIQENTNRTLTLTNPDNQTISRDLGIEFAWDGTELGIKTADDQDFTYVDLKGDTGDAAEAGTSLFRIRDDNDTANNGYLTTVSSEMQLTGTDGIEVNRSAEVFTFSLPVIDGGEF